MTRLEPTASERERHTAQLQSLADAALVIVAAGSIAEIVERSTHAARTIVGAHVAAIHLDLGDQDGVRYWSLSDTYGAAKSELALPEDLEEQVRSSGRPVYTEWIGFDGGCMGVPLIGRDAASLGVLMLANRMEVEFSAEDESILVQLAQITSHAVENARLLSERTAQRARLESLSRKLVGVHEEQRRAIALELNHEVGEILTGLQSTLQSYGRRDVPVDLEHLKKVADQLQERVRNMALNLRPPMLDEVGLIPTLLWHFERFRKETGIQSRFRHHGVLFRLPPTIEIAAFRIVQEALSNAARHAKVSEVEVEISAKGGVLTVRVENDGRGIDQDAAAPASMELPGMRERAMLAGGTLAVESRPGAGTRVFAELPLGRFGLRGRVE